MKLCTLKCQAKEENGNVENGIKSGKCGEGRQIELAD
jgi:hypothetical protein